MNKYIPLSLLLVVYVIVTSCVPARLYDESQLEVERLRQELSDLYEKCDIISSRSGTDDGIYRADCPEKNLYASITSVKASRSKQSITVNFQVLNRGANIQNTVIANDFGNIPNGTKLIYNGNSYRASSVTYAGNVNGNGDLMTDVPLKGSLTFSGILPAGDVADYISFMVRFQCELGFNNVSFDWGR
jgi:hypothetical protein